MAVFELNQRVKRIENREVVGATVVEIQESQSEIMETCYKIEYDEGGFGWWTESYLESE